MHGLKMVFQLLVNLDLPSIACHCNTPLHCFAINDNSDICQALWSTAHWGLLLSYKCLFLNNLIKETAYAFI